MVMRKSGGGNGCLACGAVARLACGTATRSRQAHQRQTQRVSHPLEPLFDGRSQVLVLGTMPSPASREVGFYYGHPQNRFWRVLAELFGAPVPATNEERAALALSHGIALWDVLASCEIEGASDASIKNAQPNDLSRVLDAAPIRAVFTTGAKAAALYRRFDAPLFPDLPHTALPSTSPANARMRLPELVEAYRPLKEAAES